MIYFPFSHTSCEHQHLRTCCFYYGKQSDMSDETGVKFLFIDRFLSVFMGHPDPKYIQRPG